MVRNPCNGSSDCSEQGCCLNCTEYTGSLEFIPTVLEICCPHNDHVKLKLHGYPEINGKVEVKCHNWSLYKGDY